MWPKGVKKSEQWKAQIREALKGRPPWNKGMRMPSSPLRGRRLPAEVRVKMSITRTRRIAEGAIRVGPRMAVIHDDGYRLVWAPGHHRARQGRVYEHIIVAERKLGRPILKNEQVHHLNGIHDDNDPDNLIVLTIGEHTALHNRLRPKSSQA